MDPQGQFCLRTEGRAGEGTSGSVVGRTSGINVAPVDGPLLQPKGYPFIGYGGRQTW
jgi:hypothetical protein